MIRQTGFAIGVALLVAIAGVHHAVEEQAQAFRAAWWIMAAITLIGLVPTFLLVRPEPARALAASK
jgi:hypothetical protein